MLNMFNDRGDNFIQASRLKNLFSGSPTFDSHRGNSLRSRPDTAMAISRSRTYGNSRA